MHFYGLLSMGFLFYEYHPEVNSWTFKFKKKNEKAQWLDHIMIQEGHFKKSMWKGKRKLKFHLI